MIAYLTRTDFRIVYLVWPLRYASLSHKTNNAEAYQLSTTLAVQEKQMDRPTQYCIYGAITGAIFGTLRGGVASAVSWAIGGFFVGLLVGIALDSVDR
ncbi:MAG TPA: hypothetical protein ENI99_03360 [Sedimenticola sp.]|nr:hypothetical protein [Sedimenticola sp.]